MVVGTGPDERLLLPSHDRKRRQSIFRALCDGETWLPPVARNDDLRPIAAHFRRLKCDAKEVRIRLIEQGFRWIFMRLLRVGSAKAVASLWDSRNAVRKLWVIQSEEKPES